MMKTKLTVTEIEWIMAALNHDIASAQEAMDKSPDGSPTWALSELFVSTRESLRNKLLDFLGSDNKTIYVQK